MCLSFQLRRACQHYRRAPWILQQLFLCTLFCWLDNIRDRIIQWCRHVGFEINVNIPDDEHKRFDVCIMFAEGSCLRLDISVTCSDQKACIRKTKYGPVAFRLLLIMSRRDWPQWFMQLWADRLRMHRGHDLTLSDPWQDLHQCSNIIWRRFQIICELACTNDYLSNISRMRGFFISNCLLVFLLEIANCP